MRLSKISWFVCGEQINIIRLRQIIDLRDTDKSWYFAITKFYQSITEFVFSMNILGKWSNLPFSCKSNHKKEKARFPLCMSRILVAAKHSWMALRMSRPLFVGSYLQVTWWALGQWKERKNLFRMILHYYSFRTFFCFWLAETSGWFFITSRHLKEERTRNNPSIWYYIGSSSFPGNNHFSWAEL